jgi:TatD DNase family protein
MTAPDLVDSHCHLDFPDFEGEVGAIVARARAAGVRRMVTICTRLRQAPHVRRIAQEHPGVFWAGGGHPLHVAEEPAVTLADLLDLSRDAKFVGIGETGLDYHYARDSRPAQIASLLVHVEAARRTGLPLIIHARDADDDMARILEDEYRAGPFTCVMHCFSSGPDLAARCLALGFYLSMSGIATFRKSDDLRAIFAAAPLDRLLVETDSPYLAPQSRRGKRNEPAHVVETAEAGAAIFGIDPAEFAARTTANFDRLFTRAATAARADAADAADAAGSAAHG